MLEKWTINRLSTETGLDRRTLKKWLEKSEPADFDGDAPLYHLATLIEAMRARESEGASNLETEKTRLTKAQADQAELNLAMARNEVLPTDVSFQACSNVLFAVRRVVETSGLTNAEKDDIYREIQAFKPEALIAEKQFEEGT
jgi:phage terminase Nu1 subunit (DNA packaging protein)